jgi:hypothetical protein
MSLIIGSGRYFLELPPVPLPPQADSYKPFTPRQLEKRII